MKKIISVISLKGGTGKTTIAVNVASSLKVELLDCDPQGSAREWNACSVRNMPVVPGWEQRVSKLEGVFIIDGPPTLGIAATSIIKVSDLILIPCTPSGLDIASTGQLLNLIGDKSEVWLIPSKVDMRTSVGKQIVEALEEFNIPVTESIGQRSAHISAFSESRSISEYATRSKANTDILHLVKRIKSWLKK